MRRRDLMIIGGALGCAAAVPPLLRRLPSAFNFEPLPGFPGFRLLLAGKVSGGIDPFIGLSDPDREQRAVSQDALSDPCRALFGPTGWRAGRVPVALFTDVNCPYCKVLERQLIDMRDRDGIVDLTWHNLPLLGPSSVRAARAILAARTLNAEATARTYMTTQSLPPGSVGLTRMAEALDLPATALIQVESSNAVSQFLDADLRLGRRLGIIGTPGTVVGRTLVIGTIRPADLRKLLALELSEPQSFCA